MKRSRGGARQSVFRLRSASDVTTSSGSGDGGNLAKLLLQLRAWGEMTTTTLQELAAAAVRDGAKCQRLTKLAGLGCNGEHPGNCDRDLDTSNNALVYCCIIASAAFSI